MSEIDFQNGFVVGMALGGKNGAVGGVVPNQSESNKSLVYVNILPVYSFPVWYCDFNEFTYSDYVHTTLSPV